MKRFYTLTLSIMMIFALSTSVMAQPLGEIEIADSFDFTSTLNVSLHVYTPEANISPPVGAVLAMFEDVTITSTSNFMTDPDNENVIGGYGEVEISYGLFNFQYGVWFDLDITDSDNPKGTVVVELPRMIASMFGNSPNNIRYIACDIEELVAISEEISNANESMDDGTMELNQAMVELANGHFDIDEALALVPEAESIGRNKYQVVVGDEWVTNFSAYLADGLLNMLNDPEFIELVLGAEEQSIQAGSINADELMLEYKRDLAETEKNINLFMNSVLPNVTIFSEDWVTEFTLNNRNLLTGFSSKMQLQFDMQEWTDATSVFMTPENSLYLEGSVPEFVATLDIQYDGTFSNINTAEKVEFPELTQENCVDIIDFFNTLSSQMSNYYDVYDVYEDFPY